MNLAFLKTADIPPIPSTVKLLKNFGNECVVLNDGAIAAEGEVIYVQASPEDMLEWLGGIEIWEGHGMSGFRKRKVKLEAA